MLSLVLAFLVSLLVSGVIIRLSRSRARPWDDHDLQGVQKNHARAVPRVGGLAIALGLAALLAWVAFTQPGHAGEMALLFACGLPGLAAVVVAIALLSLAYVGWQVGDSLVVSTTLAGVGALLGFLLWNWPRGLISLGDGGADHPE